MVETRQLFGRRVIYTDEVEITSKNLISVLTAATTHFYANRNEIDYLFEYYKGKQPILGRTKQIRPEILYNLVENSANEIVSFKTGYLMGEPIQYVSRSKKDDLVDEIEHLNNFMYSEEKASKDKELADWQHIAGTAYRITLPRVDIEDSPFETYVIDPRNAFVIYRNSYEKTPLAGVSYVKRANGRELFSVYTDKMYYEVGLSRNGGDQVDWGGSQISSATPHTLGMIPIIEYPANEARLGAFEIVIPLLDAINTVASNRSEGVEQFVQSLLVLKGMDLSENEYDSLMAKGGIRVPVEGDVKLLTGELNQAQTQTLVDHMYQTVLTICGMPNRNGGSSTSDTGSAVIMRDGWSAAEARAKDSEMLFKRSEKQFLRLVLRIMRDMSGIELGLSDVEIRFTRRNYENIMEKSQVLITMLGSPRVHPELAFEASGLFVDPNIAYMKSKEWWESNESINTGSDPEDIGNLDSGELGRDPQEEERNSDSGDDSES